MREGEGWGGVLEVEVDGEGRGDDGVRGVDGGGSFLDGKGGSLGWMCGGAGTVLFS